MGNLRHNNKKTSNVSLTSRLAIDLLKINKNKGDLNSDTIVTYRCGGYGYSSRSSGPRAPVRKSVIPPPSIEPLLARGNQLILACDISARSNVALAAQFFFQKRERMKILLVCNFI